MRYANFPKWGSHKSLRIIVTYAAVAIKNRALTNHRVRSYILCRRGQFAAEET